MKNIHVLPTENESRLRYNSFNKVYELCEFPKYHTDIKSTHNIYITFDEEIKEGDWVLFISTNEVIKVPLGGFKGKVCKKIILTTDQYLIKYGVQAIDDEFLEWFVKNPSCESVEVEEYYSFEIGDWTYKIIVPRTTQQIIDEDFDGGLTMGQIIPKEEPKPFKNMLPLTKIDWEKFKKNPIPNKKETLEEVANKMYYNTKHSYPIIPNYTNWIQGFIIGAEWQQEQIGKSEFLQKLRATISDAEARRLIFEQFKNK